MDNVLTAKIGLDTTEFKERVGKTIGAILKMAAEGTVQDRHLQRIRRGNKI
jgi:hypothetical protein